MASQISVGQALRLLVCLWLWLGVPSLVFRLLGVDAGLAIVAPVSMYLGGWWQRHQLSIWAGVLAGLVGCVVGFTLVDVLREHLAKAVADALASGIAVVPVVLVLTVWTRLSTARAGNEGERPDTMQH